MTPKTAHRSQEDRPAATWALVLALVAGAACGEAQSSGSPDAVDAGDIAAGCTTAVDCPAPLLACQVATCTSSGACLSVQAPDGTPCDDGSACTPQTACAAGVCSGPSTCCQSDADCAGADDGNLCNGLMFCDLSGDEPACKPKAGSEVSCDTSLDPACQINTCTPATGTCAPTPRVDGAACDDGNPCTANDACAAGACVGPSTCACSKDDDCKASEDGNMCNGTLYCEPTSHTCQVNPATVVVCQTSGNTACQAWQCAPSQGACGFGPRPDGTACDVDYSVCSLDTCAAGACTPGPLDSKCDCKSDADCVPFEDGNACNGKLFCHKASAKCELNPATIVSCPSVNDGACAHNLCQPTTGLCAMTPEPEGTPCDDGWLCSVGETCGAGQCQTPPGQCQCQTTADCAAYEAANGCAKLYCDKPAGVCKVNPATIKLCSELGDPLCSETKCDSKTGACAIVPTNDGGPCEADGSWCTNLDVCKGGACQPAKNKCPCTADADCKAQEDGNACNGTLYCDKPSGTCVVNPASLPSCAGEGDGPCKPLQCDAKDGACKPLPLPDGVTCDTDSFACTAERCQAGSCKLLAESCLCWDDLDCKPFEDNDLCNGTLYCDKLAGPPSCKVNPATVISCSGGDDPMSCQTFACAPSKGVCAAQPANEGKACADGDACTMEDVCKGGVCLGLAVDVTAACDEGNPCTVESCDKAKGCQHVVSVGAPCDDGDLCTSGEQCDVKGVCGSGKAVECPDAGPCKTASCKGGTCATATANEGGACDDGNICTKADVCAKGVCAGAAVVCDDGNACTSDSCQAVLGCVTLPAADGGSCSDGNPCTTKDACAGGACKGAGVVTCDDGKACTTDACDAKSGACAHTAIPGCGSATLPFVEDFACDGPAKTTWTFTAAQPTPAWGVDATPDLGACSLNFNNGKDFTCAGVSKVSGDAVSPAIVLPPGSVPVLELVLGGSWEGGTYDVLTLYVSEDGGTNWATVKVFPPPGTAWAKVTASLALWAGKTIKVRLGFATTDCVSNGGTGPAINKMRIFNNACVDVSGCNDGDACTIDTCNAGSCLSVPAPTGSNCDDGDKCTTSDVCGGIGVCAGTGKSCDDGNECTTDACGKDTGACTATPIPGCTPATAVYQEPFACGSSAWTLANPDVVPAWAIDATPGQPAPQFGSCSMNFNDGTDFTCKATSGSVKGSATSGVIDLAGSSEPKLELVYGGSWENSAFDKFQVELLDPVVDTVLQTIVLPTVGTSWKTHTQDIKAFSGKKLRLRLYFVTQDCVANQGTGPMVDRIRILAKQIACTNDAACDDANPCTKDSCLVGACAHVPVTAGTACSDGDACTSADACDIGGMCKGKAASCDDGKPCTQDACDKGTGKCTATVTVAAPCDDGNSCTTKDLCTVAGACLGTAIDCEDGNPCTADACGGDLGCSHTPQAGGPCPGGLCGGKGICVSAPDRPLGSGSNAQGFEIDKGTVVGFGYAAPGMLPVNGVTGVGPHPPKYTSLDNTVMAASSWNRSCALLADGTLRCWGVAGTQAYAPTKVSASGKLAFTWLSARGTSTWALDHKGGVWNLNAHELLPAAQQVAPSPTGGLYQRIAAGDNFACALQKGGKVWCWGQNNNKQLGPKGGQDGTEPSAPLDVIDSGVQDLCAGSDFACALETGGKIRCWGAGSAGQLGSGDLADSANPVTVLGTGDAPPPAMKAVSLRCGDFFACYATAGGQILCWGDNYAGALGAGDTKRHPTPVPVVNPDLSPLLAPGLSFWLGGAGGCARVGTTLRCWGDNGGGVLGLWKAGAAEDPYVPGPVLTAPGQPLLGVNAVVGSESVTCARSGSAPGYSWHCWGNNGGALTGPGGNPDQYWQYATPTPLLQGVEKADVSDEEGCRVVAATGRVECWGTNFREAIAGHGATLGKNDPGAVATPTEVALPAGVKASQISRSHYHACAMTDQGLFCWGINLGGLVGEPMAPMTTPPVKPLISEVVVDIQTSHNTSCARTSVGSLLCWGINGQGAIGNPKQGGQDVKSPLAVLLGKAATQLATGPFGTCAIDVDGVPWCWGFHGGKMNATGSGQVEANNHAAPVKVVGWGGASEPKADAIVGGTFHGCAATAGALRCWGDNNGGRLGLGHDDPVAVGQQPVVVPGTAGATLLYQNIDTTCAKVASGQLYCWGSRQAAATGRGVAFRSHVVMLAMPQD